LFFFFKFYFNNFISPLLFHFSFAAGTTDGPGDFDFTQGTNTSNPNVFWNFIARFLANPSKEQQDCHSPKPILLFTGAIDFPCPWTASILPLQIVQIGKLFIISVPGEFTTMSGRRYVNYL
jgi:neutral ceramidase